MKMKYNPPGLIKKLYSKYHWNTAGKILLTFDDGPTAESTPRILEVLNSHSIKGLFFCVGQNLERYPDIAGQIIDGGHVIGNHTYSHKNLRKLSNQNVDTEISKFNDIYLNLFGKDPEYFRPPYGALKLNLNKKLEVHEMMNVMWSLLTYDYKNDLNIVKFAVANYLMNNSIIVLHDSRKCADIIIDSIKYIIKSADERNFEFGEPSECLS